LTKIDDKKWSKITILNGKIEFFIKNHLIASKMSEKITKIDQKLVIKNDVKFDYQKGG